MKKLDGLKIAHQLAKNRDGKCLSREYINNNTKLNLCQVHNPESFRHLLAVFL